MKFTLEYTFDSALLKRRLQCAIKHDWTVHQGMVKFEERGDTFDMVLAFKVCDRCGKSKLIHLLL